MRTEDKKSRQQSEQLDVLPVALNLVEEYKAIFEPDLVVQIYGKLVTAQHMKLHINGDSTVLYIQT